MKKDAEEASVRRREDKAQDAIEEDERAILLGWGGVWRHNEDLVAEMLLLSACGEVKLSDEEKERREKEEDDKWDKAYSDSV